jgi:2-keto-4-pentenoate hydratase/2-oxohepta-3-ene-1,7-dioic acid hydratase in catechol pathway
MSETQEQYGVVVEDRIYPLGPEVPRKLEITGDGHALSSVSLLPPAAPTKIINVGSSYWARQELGLSMPDEPSFTYKPPSALVGTNQAVVCPREAPELRCEAELAIIIKSLAKDVSELAAKEHILGYTAHNDINAAVFLKTQPARAASYDGFSPLGPFVAADVDLRDLTIELRINGQRHQWAECGATKFSPAQIVSFLSHIMTLYPGDIISTGTPPRPQLAQPGDIAEVILEGIGTLSNHIVASK